MRVPEFLLSHYPGKTGKPGRRKEGEIRAISEIWLQPDTGIGCRNAAVGRFIEQRESKTLSSCMMTMQNDCAASGQPAAGATGESP